MPQPAMPAVVGLDIAKTVFQVHGADASGRAILRRRLRRAEVVAFFARLQPCLVGIEACPGGHHWARELVALGHQVRLIPPQCVKPFVKTNKNDAADAEAICEAVMRPGMRFVPIKTVDQQAAAMLHRTRALLLRQRTQLINALRGHLAEFGLVARKGARNIRELADLVRDTDHKALPDAARAMLVLILEQIREAQVRIAQVEHALEAWAKNSEACQRLMAIPGVGIMSATALVLAMADPSRFRSGRHFAAWLGLVPKQHSSGERERLGGISKRGDG
jgi:transposase